MSWIDLFETLQLRSLAIILIHTLSVPHKVSVCTDLTSPNRFVIDLPPNIDEVNGRARPSTVCHAVAIVQPAPARTLSSSFSLSRALKYMIKYIFASERRVRVHRYSSGMHQHQTFGRLPCREEYPEQAQALTHCPHHTHIPPPCPSLSSSSSSSSRTAETTGPLCPLTSCM